MPVTSWPTPPSRPPPMAAFLARDLGRGLQDRRGCRRISVGTSLHRRDQATARSRAEGPVKGNGGGDCVALALRCIVLLIVEDRAQGHAVLLRHRSPVGPQHRRFSAQVTAKHSPRQRWTEDEEQKLCVRMMPDGAHLLTEDVTHFDLFLGVYLHDPVARYAARPLQTSAHPHFVPMLYPHPVHK